MIKKIFFSALLIFSSLFFSVDHAFAQVSLASCNLQVSVDNTTGYVTISGEVNQLRPGRDPSSTFVHIWDFQSTEAGGVTADGVENASATYTSFFNNGTYYAYIRGESTSNPNGGTSQCTDTKAFTVNVDSQEEPSSTIIVSSNRTTGWVITGPKNYNGSGTYSSYTDATAGTYTISPDDIACYSYSVASSPQQTVSAGGSITFNINYADDGSCGSGTPPPPPPSGEAPEANIYANGQGGSITISSGASATITWDSDLVTTCTVSPSGWSGTSGSQSTGALTNSINYLLNCSGPDGNASDSVTVYVNGSVPPPSCSGNNSEFVSQSVPTTVYAGQVFPVTITMKNICSNTWTVPGSGHIYYSSGYKLGSQWWQDNENWGTARVAVPFNVTQGQTASFTFNVTAPATPGVYNFQWKMVEEYVEWFGAYTPNVQITVTEADRAPIGQLDSFNCSTINGWVFDPDTPNDYSNLKIYKDGPAGSGTLIETMRTNQNRDDVNTAYGIGGVHGYYLNTPTTLKDNQPHSIYIYGINTNPAGRDTLLTNSPATQTCGDPTFNYTLSNSGSSNVTKTSGNAYTQNVITKTLTLGATQAVSLAVSGVPSGVSYSFSNGTCSPTCTSTITFTVSNSTRAGTYPITITGSPLGKTTTFNLVVTGAPFSVSCSVSPTTALLNQNVTWSSSVSGGSSPFTYAWSGTNITSPLPNTSSFSRSYSTIGIKNAQVTVTDSESVQATCTPASVQINFDPKFEEF